MRSTLLLATALTTLISAAVACGDVNVKPDAAQNPGADASAQADAADNPGVDAAEGVADASPPDAMVSPPDAMVDAAPACIWIDIANCDTGGTIAEFCPSGSHVNQLRRCNGTTYTPDATYQMYHLCNCSFASCGCSGVAWSQVECCN